MHEFAGYDMPIEYPTGIIEEHMTVVKGVGVFDVSHMGEFWVKGPNALRFIQDITTNDASKLKVGDIQYTCFPNEQGGIVDDLLVYHYEDEKYLLVVNAANIEKDWAWCQSHNAAGAILENSCDNVGQLAIQGPLAQQVLQRLTDVDLSTIPTTPSRSAPSLAALRSSSPTRATPVLVASRSTSTPSTVRRSGTLSSKQVSPKASAPSVSALATRSVSKSASASTATISATPPLPSKLVSAGSRSSSPRRTSPARHSSSSRRPRVSSASSSPSSSLTRAYPAHTMRSLTQTATSSAK